MNQAKRICRAALRGDLLIVQELVLHDRSLVDAIEDHDTMWTPLICGAFMGQEETVRLLLREGADVNSRDKRGATALHVACKYGQANVVPLLLAAGADLSSRGVEGQSPLAMAAVSDHVDIVRTLLAHGGSDVDGRDICGRSVLFLAASKGRPRVCALLLEAGANPLMGDRRGSLAMDLALRHRHRDAAAVLQVRAEFRSELRPHAATLTLPW